MLGIGYKFLYERADLVDIIQIFKFFQRSILILCQNIVAGLVFILGVLKRPVDSRNLSKAGRELILSCFKNMKASGPTKN